MTDREAQVLSDRLRSLKTYLDSHISQLSNEDVAHKIRKGNQDMNLEPTKEEKSVIASLHRVAKKWPESLWLFSASGTLWVMRHDDEGNCAMLPCGGVDPDYTIDIIKIENDGGDW